MFEVCWFRSGIVFVFCIRSVFVLCSVWYCIVFVLYSFCVGSVFVLYSHYIRTFIRSVCFGGAGVVAFFMSTVCVL